MPKLTPETQQARQEKILLAALDCFATEGFSNTSMSDIIKASGLSSGSIYSHFTSKDEIIESTAKYTFERIAEIFPPKISKDSSPQEIFVFLLENHPLSQHFNTLIQFFAEASTNPEILAIAQHSLATIKKMLADLLSPWAQKQDGDTDELVNKVTDQFILLFHGYIMRVSLDQNINRAELAHLAAKLLPA